MAITFTRGLHSRPFAQQHWKMPEVEFDYGGQLTAYLDAASSWPVVGVDLSYWQESLDALKLKQKAQFAILRYGYGNNTVDGKLDEFYRKVTDEGIVPMAYWYIKPGKSVDKHVDTFLGLLHNYPAKAIFGDVEEDGGFDKNDLHNWLNKLFNQLYEGWSDLNSFNDKQVQNTFGIYTSPGFWNSNMPLTSWAKNLMLWDAHWTTADQPVLPNEWINKSWKFWQWSSKGNGNDYGVGSTYVDLNRYYGQISDFNNQFGTSIEPLPGEPEPPPPPPPPPSGHEPVVPSKTVKVTATALNVRSLPEVLDDNDLGTLLKNSIVPITEQDGVWGKVEGWIHLGYTVETLER